MSYYFSRTISNCIYSLEIIKHKHGDCDNSNLVNHRCIGDKLPIKGIDYHNESIYNVCHATLYGDDVTCDCTRF